MWAGLRRDRVLQLWLLVQLIVSGPVILPDTSWKCKE